MACCGIYAALAMLVFGHFGALGPSHLAGDGSDDAVSQVWWLAWTAYALTHGQDVFVTHWLNYPAGQNFGVNGSMLTLGIISLPITKLFGPVVTWNIAVRLALASSATSMCFVVRRWTTTWGAAFVGGLLYGFSGYMLWNGGNGTYLFLIFVPLPPIFFLLLHEILVRQRWPPGRTGILLAVVITLQFFIFTEVMASMLVMGFIATGLYLAINHRDLASRSRYMAKAFACTLGATLLCLGYPSWVTLAGPQHVNGAPFSPASLALFPSDLLGPVIPNGEWLHPSFLTMTDPTILYPIRDLESGQMYLGIPLVVAVVMFCVFFRRRREIPFAGAMAAIAFILSLGSRLYVGGHETSVLLPFAAFYHLPVLSGFLAARFSLYTCLFTSVMFAVGVDELWPRLLRLRSLSTRSPWMRRAMGIVVIGVMALAATIPLVPRSAHPTTPTNVPAFFTSGDVKAIPAGSVTLAFPYTDHVSDALENSSALEQSVMIDQAAAGMRFKLIGGFGWFPSPTGHFGFNGPAALEPQSVQDLFDVGLAGGTPDQRATLSTTNLTADIRHFLDSYHVETVVVIKVGAHPGLVESAITSAIGPPVDEGGVMVWLQVQRRVAEYRPAPVRTAFDAPSRSSPMDLSLGSRTGAAQ